MTTSNKKVRDATRPLAFKITKKHVKDAKCGDPEQCVIAQAIRDALPDHVAEIHVGAMVTKVVDYNGNVIRYATPPKLHDALHGFDLNRGWKLPDGDYRLNPLPPSKRLGKQASAGASTFGPRKKKPGSKGWNQFNSKAPPTRHVVRVEVVATQAARRAT